MGRRRSDVLKSLVEMIPRFGLRKFSCSINLALLKSVPDEIKNNFRLHAYPLCARTVATYVDLWAMKERPSIPRERIEYVFEEGDEDKDALVRTMNEDGYPTPIFRYKHDCIVRGRKHVGFTPLQAADILAWHVYQIQKEWIANPHRTKEEILNLARLPVEELENMLEMPMTITESDLEHYITMTAYVETRRRFLAAQGDAPFHIDTL